MKELEQLLIREWLVVEVCVGFAERRKAAIRATRLLLERYGYGNVTVTETEIPFSG